jgi:hypothetical protein
MFEPFDARKNVVLRLPAEALQGGKAVFMAGVFQLTYGFNPQLPIEGMDLFRPQAGDLEHLQMTRRNGCPELLIIVQFARLHEFHDLLADGLADAVDLIDFSLRNEIIKIGVCFFQVAGGGLIGAGLKRVISGQFQ